MFRLSDNLVFGSLLAWYMLLYKSPHSIVYNLVFVNFFWLPKQLSWFLAAFWFMFMKNSLLYYMQPTGTTNHSPDWSHPIWDTNMTEGRPEVTVSLSQISILSTVTNVCFCFISSIGALTRPFFPPETLPVFPAFLFSEWIYAVFSCF